MARAGMYMELSPSQAEIDTPARTTRPWLADFRVGYETPGQQLELALMRGINDDNINQLSVDVPWVVSVFYRYLPEVNSRIKLHLILGMSQIEVESSYPGTADTVDRFDGVSFGIGFEESFQSNPQMKLTLDWIRLYQGDQININATSFGFHYAF